MPTQQNPLIALILRYAAGLRFPHLLGLMAGLFLLNLIIPDRLPYVDEILLGLATLLLASLRRPAPRQPHSPSRGRVFDHQP